MSITVAISQIYLEPYIGEHDSLIGEKNREMIHNEPFSRFLKRNWNLF
jgi:hypothetical protein